MGHFNNYVKLARSGRAGKILAITGCQTEDNS